MKITTTYILIVLLLTFGCSFAENKNDTKNVDTNKAEKNDTIHAIIEDTLFVNDIEIQNYITDDFIRIVNYIDSCGFICDSNRIKNVSGYFELDNKNVQIIDNKYFYKININEHEIFKVKKRIEKYNNAVKKDTINSIPLKKNDANYKAFRKVVTIYGYFYREDVESNFIHDGMIEEWKFETFEDAKHALTEVKKVGYIL